MDDAGRHRFSKRGRERTLSEDGDALRNGPFLQDCLTPGDYGNGSNNKSEKWAQKKKGTQGIYGSSPRKGAHYIVNSPAALGSSPGARRNDSYKDQLKKWLSDEHRSHSENWRDHRSPAKNHAVPRSRRDSTQETEGSWRGQETSEKGSKSVRRQLQKELMNEEMPEMQAVGMGNKNQKKPKKPKRTRKSEHEYGEDLDAPVVDESALSEKDLLGLRQAEERLFRDFIHRLKRRPRSYPTAKYSCKLCDVLVESVASAHKHIKEKRHKKNIKEKREEELLTTLPPPTAAQVQAVGMAIGEVVQEFGLSDEDVEQRRKIVQAMERIVHQTLPGCSLRLYGSSCTKFGFKTSDVNIDIQFPASMNQPDVLLHVQESLKNSESFEAVEADFHVRVPVVVCREKQSGLLCRVSAGNEAACLTTNHLAALAKLEPRLVLLVVAFRHWAKLCQIDNPEEGGLPPYVLAFLVIFFLQQRKDPLLPVYLGLWIEGYSTSRLAHFSLKGVEEHEVVWEYNPSLDDASPLNEELVRRGKVPLIFAADRQCDVPAGQLWVELFRFFALEFSITDFVVNIRVKELVSRESKDWPKKRFAIEDPYSVKRNVARTVNSQLVYEYIHHCLRTTYKYFALPHKKIMKSSKKSQQKPDIDVLQQLEPQNDNIESCQLVKKIPNYEKSISTKLDNVISSHNSGPVMDAMSAQSVDINCMLNGTEFVTEDELEASMRNMEITQHSEHAIKAHLECSEDIKPSGDDTSSENDVEKGEKWHKHLSLLEQGVDEDSENGEFSNLAYCSTEPDIETESLSDFDGFQIPGTIESDDLGLEDGGELEDKEDTDEESLDDTDELDDSPNKFIPFGLGQSVIDNSDDEDDEELDLIIDQRVHLDSITTEEELQNTYIGSEEDDVQSVDEELSSTRGGTEVKADSKGALESETITCSFLKEFTLSYTGLPDQEGEDVNKVAVHDGPTNRSKHEESELFYGFNKNVFTKGKVPTVVCSLCKREGHLKRDCPEDFKKLELEPLPQMTPKFLNILNQVCTQCYMDFSPDTIEDQAREHIRENLETSIRQEFPGAKLSLFGSSKNGFGFKQSDLDICMTFEGRETAEGLNCIKIIEELARVLKKHSGLRNILPITTAKVPIVKFIHSRSGLEGDISLYNTLALHNTRLLSSYAAIDPRVKCLCYTMKVFAKMCDIGDASRGSLSSYAYTLMVLYFLQQRNLPVIPVLQEIYDGPRKPEILVDNWNVYFFSQLDELQNRWPDYGKNTESVGELWLGLLRFYTEEFDFKEHVISIRRKNLLTTFKKQWTSKYIVIEDPFDLNHNLGAGLSRKMTNFILKAFINGRRVFGTPIKVFPKEYDTKMEYFFDPEVLTEGELAPNDRCCRICGKIGHFMKECPMRRKLRRKRDQEESKTQRYQENKLKRTQDGKEPHIKDAEREFSAREGKAQLSTPKKSRQDKGTPDSGRDKTLRQSTEKWRRQDDREFREKRCFICGMEGHIKKDCPHYKGPAGRGPE